MKDILVGDLLIYGGPVSAVLLRQFFVWRGRVRQAQTAAMGSGSKGMEQLPEGEQRWLRKQYPIHVQLVQRLLLRLCPNEAPIRIRELAETAVSLGFRAFIKGRIGFVGEITQQQWEQALQAEVLAHTIDLRRLELELAADPEVNLDGC